MSLTGGHLDALLEAGATAEQIVALVKADMVEREKALEIRRSKDAERQRRKRSRGVTRTRRDTPPNERDNLTPPCEEKPEPNGSVKNAFDEKRDAIGSCLKAAFPPPDGVPEPVWADFLKSPKRKKAGMSPTAYAGIANNLKLLAEHGFPPGEMIALAVERGWTTVKLDWVKSDERQVGKSAAAYASLVAGLSPDEPF